MPSTVFKTYDDAIKELRSKGMYVSNPRAAKEYLELFSAYNVINGCADILRDPNNPQNFRTGSSFVELKALHHFDESLRRCLTHYVLKIESVVKSRATYQFCCALKPDGTPRRGPCDYLAPSSYDSSQPGEAKRLISCLSSIIAKNFGKPGPIQEYVRHGINPPPIWVLATGMSFGNMLSFYECLLPSERNQVAKTFGIPEDVFDSFLLVLRDFRNTLAHSNRVFCFKTVHRPKRIMLSPGHFDRVENSSELKFGSVLFVLSHLLPQNEFRRMINEISTLTMGLSKKLQSISIQDVAMEMGIPNSMRNRYNLKLSSPVVSASTFE